MYIFFLVCVAVQLRSQILRFLLRNSIYFKSATSLNQTIFSKIMMLSRVMNSLSALFHQRILTSGHLQLHLRNSGQSNCSVFVFSPCDYYI